MIQFSQLVNSLFHSDGEAVDQTLPNFRPMVRCWHDVGTAVVRRFDVGAPWDFDSVKTSEPRASLEVS